MSRANVVPARPEGLSDAALRLDHNERLRPAPELVELLGRVPGAVLTRYPCATGLERRIADLWEVEPDRVLATAGGDDGIDRACRLFLHRRPELVTATPTFEMFPLCAELAGGRLIGIPSLHDPAPLEELLGAVGERTGLVVAITPHNPTGAAIAGETLLTLADALPAGTPLLVDLAYAEFADEDPTAELAARDDILVLRTLSKAWGLAGLRVGYLLGTPATIARLRESGPPFPLAGPSVWLAERALELGERVTRPYVDAVRAERTRLAETLADLGAEPFPSQANFVLVRVSGAGEAWTALRRRGVRVRRFASDPELLRITLPGAPDAYRTLEAALRDALSERRAR